VAHRLKLFQNIKKHYLSARTCKDVSTKWTINSPFQRTFEFRNFIAIDISTVEKSIINLVNLGEVWLQNIVNVLKYRHLKFANFVYFCMLLPYTHGKVIITSKSDYHFAMRNTKVFKIHKL
jgi:hypothetical protein